MSGQYLAGVRICCMEIEGGCGRDSWGEEKGRMTHPDQVERLNFFSFFFKATVLSENLALYTVSEIEII